MTRWRDPRLPKRWTDAGLDPTRIVVNRVVHAILAAGDRQTARQRRLNVAIDARLSELESEMERRRAARR